MGMHFHLRDSSFLHISYLWPVNFQGNNCLKIKWFLQYIHQISLINPGTYHPSWKYQTSTAMHADSNSENIMKLLL